jgi:ketosteroid isomerase-like protein
MKIRKIILLSFFSCATILLEAQSKDSLEILNKTQTFITAFAQFDWNTFRSCFSDDATIFFPAWEEGTRRIGRKEFEKTWTDIFPEFIDSSKKFDLKIDPENIFIQMYDHSSIVTFHLGEKSKYLSRRTLVFIKENNVWKIAHLHASNVTKPEN